METCILADNQFITSQGLAALLERIGIANIVRVRTVSGLQEKLSVFPEALVVLDYALFDFVSMQQMLNLRSAAQRSAWILFSNELGEHFLRLIGNCQMMINNAAHH